MEHLTNLLQNPAIWKRAVAALALGNALMFAAWTTGYLWLPEGLLQGKTGASVVTDRMVDTSTRVLAVQVLAFNAAVAFVVMPLVGKLAVGRLSLAYVLSFGHWALYGLFLGTNSFSNPGPAVRPPGVDVYAGTGPWEIAAYTMVAAVVALRFRYRQEGWLTTRMQKAAAPPKPMNAAEWSWLGAALVLLVVTAWLESAKILGN